MTKKNIDIKKIFNNFLKKIKLKYLSLSIAKQIVLIGAILWILSLFFPWIIDKWTEINSWNSFNSITWNIGFIMIFIFLFQFFLVLSNSYKEKLKLYSNIDLKNYFLIIISGIIAIILSIVLVSFVSGLELFSQSIKYGKWPIFCIISWILIIIWWIFMRKDFNKNNSEIILEEMAKNREKNKQTKENMELPF